jgi:hypothetical protein
MKLQIYMHQIHVFSTRLILPRTRKQSLHHLCHKALHCFVFQSSCLFWENFFLHRRTKICPVLLAVMNFFSDRVQTSARRGQPNLDMRQHPSYAGPRMPRPVGPNIFSQVGISWTHSASCFGSWTTQNHLLKPVWAPCNNHPYCTCPNYWSMTISIE